MLSKDGGEAKILASPPGAERGRHFPFEVGSFGSPLLPVKQRGDCRVRAPGAAGERGPWRKTSALISSFPPRAALPISMATGFPVETGQAMMSFTVSPIREPRAWTPSPAPPTEQGSDLLGGVSVRVCDHGWSHRAGHKPAFYLVKKEYMLTVLSSELLWCPKEGGGEVALSGFADRVNKGFAVLSQYSPVSSGFHLQS